MAVIKTLAVSAENTWSAKFALGGDYTLGRETSRALICATSDASIVTLRRYSADGTTVIASLTLDSVMTAVEIPATGIYDVGVATGNYGGAALTITVEQ